MKHEYHEGPETWRRFQEGMKNLFRVPKSTVVAEEKPKPALKRKPKKASKG